MLDMRERLLLIEKEKTELILAIDTMEQLQYVGEYNLEDMI